MASVVVVEKKPNQQKSRQGRQARRSNSKNTTTTVVVNQPAKRGPPARKPKPPRKSRAVARAAFQKQAQHRLSYLMKAFVLPAESPPQRLTNNGGYPTVVTKYSAMLGNLDVKIANEAGTNTPWLGGEHLPGAVVIMSRQPSRPLGYAPANTTDTTRIFKFWFYDQPRATSGPSVAVDPSKRSVVATFSHPDLATAFGEYQEGIFDTDTLTMSGVAFKPAAASIGDTDTPGPWAEHIGIEGGDEYVWLDAEAQICVNLKIGVVHQAPEGVSSSFVMNSTLQATRWQEEKTDESVFANVPFAWQVDSTSTGAGKVVEHTTQRWLKIKNPGYYKVSTTDIVTEMVTRAAGDVLAIRDLTFGMLTYRPGLGMLWTQTPEMLQQPLLYESCRCTATAFLMSNRTAEMYRGGTAAAATARDESGMMSLYTTPGRLLARSAVKEAGYNGDLKNGVYHWVKPGLDDTRPVSWVNAIGMPIYYMARQSSVSIVYLTTTSTNDQTLALFADLHIESEVTDSQSYGRQAVPKLFTRDYEDALATIADWYMWHENPSHVVDYLKKIGAASWSAFKFLAPHLITAATAAAGGATPAAAMRAVIRSLVGSG